MQPKFTKHSNPLTFLNENFDGLGDTITGRCESFIEEKFSLPLTHYYRSTTDAVKQEPVKAINFLKENYYDYRSFFIPFIDKVLLLVVKSFKKNNFQGIDFFSFQKKFLKLLEKEYLKTLEISGFFKNNKQYNISYSHRYFGNLHSIIVLILNKKDLWHDPQWEN